MCALSCRMLRVIALATAAFLSVSARDQDVMDSNNNVIASLMGSSGGMKIYSRVGSKNGKDGFLMMKLGKLVEKNPNDNSEVDKMSMDGADEPWNNFTQDGSLFTSNFTQIGSDKQKTETGPSFTLIVHINKDTTQRVTTDFVRCTNCSDKDGNKTKGDCRNPDNTCSKSTNNTCVSSTPCSKTVTVVGYTLKFSFRLSNWTFQNASNSLFFSITMETKNGAGGPRNQRDAQQKKTKVVVDGGYADMPETADINGGSQQKSREAASS